MSRETPDPTDVIRDYFERKCELQSLPVEIPEAKVVLQYQGSALCMNDAPLEIISVDHEADEVYEPFHEPVMKYYENTGDELPSQVIPAKEGWQKNDKIMLMPKHNITKDDGLLIAFMANRYAWGMNISCCYLDVQNKKLYMYKSYNYDHPEGIALRRTPCGLGTEVFYYYGDDLDPDLVEEDARGVVHRAGETGGLCSGWWNGEYTADNFAKLASQIHSSSSHN